jgi:hypothetical protein
MTSTGRTFAGELLHFARSVDIVDDRIFEGVRVLMYKYVKEELGAAYFELMRGQTIDGGSILKMFWSIDDEEHYWPIKAPNDSYTNIVTMAYAKQQPLWVVDQDKRALSDSDALQDEWSHNADLPHYQPVKDEPIRMLVVLPLRRQRPLGVCYFESLAHIGITDVAKVELKLLADAIAILLELYEANRTQSAMTSSAILELQAQLEQAKFPRLTKPHFFLAFSNRADPRVTTVIREALHQFSTQIDFTDWQRIDEAGNVNAQIAREITRSRFGICYLSEPAKEPTEAGVQYVDNPNVVFEAGMLHARTAANESTDDGEPAGWIPMRESASPPAPFDFRAERTLEIPRFDDGTLNEDRLRAMLTEQIAKLINEE